MNTQLIQHLHIKSILSRWRSSLAFSLALSLALCIEAYGDPFLRRTNVQNRLIKMGPRNAYPILNPRALALGFAGIAGSNSGSALLLNPAGMLLSGTYELNGYYARSESADNVIGVSAIDAQAHSQKLALGLGYQTQLLEGDFVEHYGVMGIAFGLGNFLERPVFAGLNGHYLYDVQSTGDYFDLDLGLMSPVSDQIKLGAVALNMLEDLKFGLGVEFVTQQLGLNLDFLSAQDQDAYEIRGGVELKISEQIVMRGGYQHRLSQEDRPQWSGPASFALGVGVFGLGGGQGRVDLSYQQTLLKNSEAYLFCLGIQGFLDARRQQRPIYQ